MGFIQCVASLGSTCPHLLSEYSLESGSPRGWTLRSAVTLQYILDTSFPTIFLPILSGSPQPYFIHIPGQGQHPSISLTCFPHIQLKSNCTQGSDRKLWQSKMVYSLEITRCYFRVSENPNTQESRGPKTCIILIAQLYCQSNDNRFPEVMFYKMIYNYELYYLS